MIVGFKGVPAGIDQSMLRQHVIDCVRMGLHNPELRVLDLAALRVEVTHCEQAVECAPDWRRFYNKELPVDLENNLIVDNGCAFIRVMTYGKDVEAVPERIWKMRGWITMQGEKPIGWTR